MTAREREIIEAADAWYRAVGCLTFEHARDPLSARLCRAVEEQLSYERIKREIKAEEGGEC